MINIPTECMHIAMKAARLFLLDIRRRLLPFATSLSVKYPKWYVIAPSALWACSVGVSRMNEGVHYPSDVLAGAAIGAGCAVVNIYVNKLAE